MPPRLRPVSRCSEEAQGTDAASLSSFSFLGARFPPAWASREALVATAGFASKSWPARTPGE
eukprot:5926570-Pyramimonas_sp.AAC.1